MRRHTMSTEQWSTTMSEAQLPKREDVEAYWAAVLAGMDAALDRLMAMNDEDKALLYLKRNE